jgi:hypothetical protein
MIRRLIRTIAHAALWFILAGCAYSFSGSVHRLTSVRHSNDSIQIELETRIENFKLKHTVDGYEVNCEKSWLIVWGKPFKLNTANPQDSNLTVIDLQRLEVKSAVSFNKGIHEVSYTAGQRTAIIWTTLGTPLDLGSGKTISPTSESDSTLSLEACDNFAHKSFRKYSQ